MRPVWVTHTHTVTALGDNLNELWKGLLSGQSGIRPVTRFKVENYKANIAACIKDLNDKKNGLMMPALLNRLLTDMQPVPEDSRLITATTKSGIDNLELLCRDHKSDPSKVLPTFIPDYISDKLGLSDKGINISAACASSTIAIARASALIASGEADSVLVCCADLVTEFVLSGFSCLQALSSEACKPFDKNRSGLSLGEGAAAIMLMSEEKAKKIGSPHLGTILGWGVANDATHITAPARDGCGLIQAVNLALSKAQLNKDDIAAISAHGTGTIYNDLMELTAFTTVFGKQKIPVHSIKGAIGHTLGSAGGIEVAVGLKTLFNQIVPPTKRCSDPEDMATGLVSNKAKEISGNYMLTTNSGFGGINAALILGKGNIE